MMGAQGIARGLCFVVVAGILVTAGCEDELSGPTEGRPASGTISGRVTIRGDGTPMVGAIVGTTPATILALTGADGRFEIRDVPIPGPVTYQVTAVKDGFLPDSRPASLDEVIRAATVDLQLTPPLPLLPIPPKGFANLEVLVTRQDGSPVAGAAVTILRLGSTTSSPVQVTGDDGRARFFPIGPGTYLVEASASILGFPFFGSAGAEVVLNRITQARVVVHRVF